MIARDSDVATAAAFSRCRTAIDRRCPAAAGTNFHETAAVTGMWHVLGHINGNAMYNNTDPAFTEFVEYTLARWEYLYPYDVALWATIADFPYSWPLWQRYSNKFVTTKLVSPISGNRCRV